MLTHMLRGGNAKLIRFMLGSGTKFDGSIRLFPSVRYCILPGAVWCDAVHTFSHTRVSENTGHINKAQPIKMAAPMSQSTQPAINPAIPAESHPQPSQSQAQTDIDPVAKVKILLLPRLKDSLVVSLCFKLCNQFSRLFLKRSSASPVIVCRLSGLINRSLSQTFYGISF